MVIKSEGDIDIGANPSAEEAAEALESGATQVNNVVDSMRLQSTSFDKKSYQIYLKVGPSVRLSMNERANVVGVSRVMVTDGVFSFWCRTTSRRSPPTSRRTTPNDSRHSKRA